MRATALHEAGAQRSALALTAQALAAIGGLGELEREAAVLHFKGLLHHELEERAEAVRCLERALEIRRHRGYPGVAASLFNLGLVREELGEGDAAETCFREALERFRRRQDAEGMAAAGSALADRSRGWNTRGVARFQKGELDEAVAAFERALELAREAPAEAGPLSLVLQNLGESYHRAARFDDALRCFEEARAIRHESGDVGGEGTSLHHIGAVHQDLGRWQEALSALHRARELRQRAGDRAGAEHSLNNIALIHHYMGDLERALSLYQEGLALVRELGDRASEAVSLNNIGGVFNEMGRYREAAGYYRQALELRREVGDAAGELATLINLSAIDQRLGRHRESLAGNRRALELARKLGNPFHEADALHSLGSHLMQLRRLDEARDCLQRALTLRRRLGVRQREVGTLTNLAVLAEALGEDDEAETLLREALERVESQRGELLSADLQSGYFAGMYDVYTLYLALLVRRGKLQRALDAAERGKARAFLDLLAEARAEPGAGVDPEVGRLLAALAGLRQRLRASAAAGGDAAAAVAELARQERELEAELQVREAEVRRRSPHRAAMAGSEVWGIERLQTDLLDGQTALLEFVVSLQGSYLFVVTRDRVELFSLPAREELEERVRLLRSAVLSRQDAGLLAWRLYRDLLAPAEPLLADRQRLLIVPDGPLSSLPFALLLTAPPPAGGEPLPALVRRHALVYAPSATVAGLLRSARPAPGGAYDQDLAAFADPETAAPGEVLSGPLAVALADVRAGGPLAPLPFTRAEAVGVAGLFEHPRELEAVAAGRADRYDGRRVDLRLRGEATKEAVLARFDPAAAPRTVRFVHLATHGLLDEEKPRFSGLVLSPSRGGDPFWRTFEVFAARIPADLVVLSACETGLGKVVRGEGLVGLARAFFHAGAASVCASLWQVADRQTAELMVAFYRHLVKPGAGSPADKAEALRRAQLGFLDAGGRRADPFYWAPFVLLGDPG